MDAIVFYILMPAILMLFFIHFNFKRIKLLTTINGYLLFKKYLFNRKINVAISKKTACSFFYFFSITVIIAPSFCIWQLVEWDIWEDMFSLKQTLCLAYLSTEKRIRITVRKCFFWQIDIAVHPCWLTKDGT